MLKVATWNVNSLTVRLEQVVAWLLQEGVDILALQETKIVDIAFPEAIFNTHGYHVVFSGEKTYNGVALVSKVPIESVVTTIPEWGDPQRRLLAATVAGIRFINLYVPNGAAVGSEKYAYKLRWLSNVTALIKRELGVHKDVVVLGDFNIAPTNEDVHDPLTLEGSVLVSPLEREAFSQLIALGLEDSFRKWHQESQAYSWWDYRAASFRRNRGLRIDHILLSHALSGRCIDANIDITPRRSSRPSDHAPVWALFSDVV